MLVQICSSTFLGTTTKNILFRFASNENSQYESLISVFKESQISCGGAWYTNIYTQKKQGNIIIDPKNISLRKNYEQLNNWLDKNTQFDTVSALLRTIYTEGDKAAITLQKQQRTVSKSNSLKSNSPSKS